MTIERIRTWVVEGEKDEEESDPSQTSDSEDDDPTSDDNGDDLTKEVD